VRVHRLIRALAALVLAGAVQAPASMADSIAVSAMELRSLAATALQRGRPELALSYAEALLDRDRSDIDALLLRSRAARDLGDTGLARRSGTEAWRVAEAADDRHAAALVTAQALATAGRRTQAQWWLRRAAHTAPTPDARQRAIRDFRYVRARNPWATDLSFSVAPSSNVNGGSARATTRLYDLPFDFRLAGQARALSGTEIAAGISTRYRIAGSARGDRTEVLLRANYRTYRLSEAARQQAPNARGSDFAFGSLAFTLAREWRPGDARLPAQVSATLGQTWYGGAPYMRFVRAAGARNWALDQRTAVHLSLSAEAQQGHGSTADSHKLRLSTGTTRVLSGGHKLRLSVAATASRSDATTRDYDRLEADARLALARPVLGLDLGVGVTVAHETYEGAFFGMQGRDDTEIAIEVTADLPAVEYHGFIPSLTLRGTRNQSSVALYDTEQLGLEIGWRSAF
jgi:hypothetical protein